MVPVIRPWRDATPDIATPATWDTPFNDIRSASTRRFIWRSDAIPEIWNAPCPEIPSAEITFHIFPALVTLADILSACIP